MIPDIPMDAIENDGERTVYAALKEQLPENWIVRYHLAFCRRRGRSLSPDGEVDFIVVIPNCGLLFLEVKGKRDATFLSEGGQCYWQQQNGTRIPEKNPFQQAQSNKHDIVKMIKDDLGMGEYFRGCYGHAVVFPFAGATGQFPNSQEPQIVWLYRDMQNLHNACLNAIDKFGTEQNARQFNAVIERQVSQWLRDKIELVPVSVANIETDERVISTLTQTQFEAVKGALENPRVRVEGVAGSGKTLIALWLAQELAANGQRVLVLCYNKLLAAWLRTQTEGVEIHHFHELARQLCHRTQVPFQVPVNANEKLKFWRDSVPILLCEAIDNLGEASKYDAILVDEAQDFTTDWWAPIEMLLKTDNNLYLFMDAQQGIYGQDNPLPFTTVCYRLAHNCRNTKLIASTAGNVLRQEIPSKTGIPDGVAPVIRRPEPNVTRRGQQLNTLVIQLLNEGYRPQEIALLSPWARNNQNCSLPQTIRGLRVLGEPDNLAEWFRGECIWGGTIKSFKGLEAKCIVLVDVPDYSPIFTQADLYVAVSRAKHRLYCIPMSPNVTQRMLE
jgi:hypothetical protein